MKKVVQTSIFATAVFFLSAGISFGAELDDLDVTIRMVESDDLTEMHNELSLPAAASDTAREHAEAENGQGLTQANEARSPEHQAEHDNMPEASDEARDERVDEIENHDEAREDKDDLSAEHEDVKEEVTHEQEHETTDN